MYDIPNNLSLPLSNASIAITCIAATFPIKSPLSLNDVESTISMIVGIINCTIAQGKTAPQI